MNNVLDDLEYRGLIKDYSNKEEMKRLLSTPQTIYCGFDPSASSMHLGNFVLISLLMRLQKAGHRIIALVGGATGMIGDPSGKSLERNLQDEETLKKNVLSIKSQLERFLDFSDQKKGVLLNNYEWLGKMSMVEFLRDYGKYFSINYLLGKDIISSRLESGISFTEFTYNILQAIDFLYLYKNEGCFIQVGGSDQWGNLTSGLELIRKCVKEPKASVMTMHLLLRSDGKKFGKSESGALFLDPKLTSPFKLYQYFINCSDEDAIKYIKVLTFLSKEEISRLEIEHNANLGQRIAQKVLAKEVVTIIHGIEKSDEAVNMTTCLFTGDVASLSKSQIEDLFLDYLVEISNNITLEDALLEIKAAPSKREARTLISNGAIMVNGKKVLDNLYVLNKDKSLHGQYFIIRRGKKLYYLAKI